MIEQLRWRIASIFIPSESKRTLSRSLLREALRGNNFDNLSLIRALGAKPELTEMVMAINDVYYCQTDEKRSPVPIALLSEQFCELCAMFKESGINLNDNTFPFSETSTNLIEEAMYWGLGPKVLEYLLNAGCQPTDENLRTAKKTGNEKYLGILQAFISVDNSVATPSPIIKPQQQNLQTAEHKVVNLDQRKSQPRKPIKTQDQELER